MNAYAAAKGGYPVEPGWKARDTAEKAARDMGAKAPTLRDRVLADLKRAPGCPESVASALKLDILAVRPRFSELATLDLIEDSGARAVSRSGKSAIVWQVKGWTYGD